MALTLVKEDGTGLANANSYASAADGDAFHEGHVWASSWTGATTGTKESALVMATRFIDACYQFGGHKANDDQALQWPRARCLDPDKWQGNPDSILDSARGSYFDDDVIPAALKNATIEFARELIKSDSTNAPTGQGIKEFTVTGATKVVYDKKYTQPVVPRTVQLMLMKLGEYLDRKSGSVRLVRV